jgi:hypothetical protein
VATVFPGRYTARVDRPVVVFAIGMRLNRPHAVHRWARPMTNTVRMWWHVQRRRPSGYLGGYLFVYWCGVGMMQYWEDVDQLVAFSHDTTQPHLAAWRQLASLTRNDQTFGYWHETYEVAPGTSESIYGSMPRFGLAGAAPHEPIRTATESAHARLRAATVDGDRTHYGQQS